ncbi:hypothetical protein R1flu_008901 [Riccia fluitans]|uniref:Uncharacterized protein n=1 Tax=Riccia fluitans TaxID=41844 RepID=A0ABD1Z342_9MARC
MLMKALDMHPAGLSFDAPRSCQFAPRECLILLLDFEELCVFGPARMPENYQNTFLLWRLLNCDPDREEQRIEVVERRFHEKGGRRETVKIHGGEMIMRKKEMEVDMGKTTIREKMKPS